MLFQALKSHIYDNIKLQVYESTKKLTWPGRKLKIQSVVAAFCMDFMDFSQDCSKFHQGGLSQVKENVLLPPIHMWHFDTDFTDFHKKFERELKINLWLLHLARTSRT